MTDADLPQRAETIHDRLPAEIDVTQAEIEEKLDTLVNQYQVPLDEARRSVTNDLAADTDADASDFTLDDQAVDIGTIDDPEQWVDLTAKVVELWEPRSEAIGQVGLLGDETGRIKFTAWAKSDLPALKTDGVYQLENLVTDEYEGQYSVKLNSTTTITKLDTDIEVGDDTSELTGAIVDIQGGSGLIKRCPTEDCTRVLQNGRCSEHGEVDGEFDLRIKAVFDDGETAQDVLFDREATEALTGIGLEEAKTMAKDALDTSVVGDKITTDIIGEYYRVTGPIMGRYLLVNEFEQAGQVDAPTEILRRARAL